MLPLFSPTALVKLREVLQGNTQSIMKQSSIVAFITSLRANIRITPSVIRGNIFSLLDPHLCALLRLFPLQLRKKTGALNCIGTRLSLDWTPV